MSETKRKQTTTKTAKRTTTKAAPAEAKAIQPASKQARLIEMLRQPEGVTIDEIVKTLDWQAHTVRGSMSGALKKKLGFTIESQKVDGRGRVYRIAG
ncbi:DUF3489 domain-containing protein [uncultured Reyranella sp.]|uniref:DUF3489 domain-containing protein n=1 Tax=uncultured Reyranella sp. TaxID=735512 RepID=UPI0025F617A4|nr:DUF3489 domain-containing protein [uncultured Reyranella sp.]